MTGELARRLQNLRARLVGLPRPAKRTATVLLDVTMLACCLAVALLLRFDSFARAPDLTAWLYAAAVAAALAAFAILGLYRAVIRYIGFRILLTVAGGSAVSALAIWAVAAAFVRGGLPLAVSVIYWMCAMVGITGVRLLARWLLVPHMTSRLPVVIYGAGEAGAQLASTLALGGKMSPIAYIDEKKSLHGATVAGVPVLPPERLQAVISDYGVKHVLLAVPAATRRRRAEIIQQLVDLGVHVQTVPDLYDILSGRAALADLRDISLADLLGRDPVAPQASLLEAGIRNKVVMVTGAGGSIGSELCRQIIDLGPRCLVLFELSELALYEMERELRSALRSKGVSLELVALLGNSRHRDRLRAIMLAYGVQTVYHASAYKHVPIVEQNLVEGIHNNVLATWSAAEAAVDARVETFVLVSTDKAVHPTNVMGATKRFAEIVLQAMHDRQSATRFCMVRFGNVLGSSGSVVPLFQEQIRAGGPVTVTHPEVRRYLMTIPEAASLVLQAGSMAKGGEVFVLDMGQPVRIDNLARRMILLSGRTLRDERNPEGDIEIHYTGLRPGEKLYEELLIGEHVSGTDHPMILRAQEHSPGWDAVQALLAEMQRALERFDCDTARKLLGQAVREYEPAATIHDLVWSVRHEPQAATAERAADWRQAESAARRLRVVAAPAPSRSGSLPPALPLTRSLSGPAIPGGPPALPGSESAFPPVPVAARPASGAAPESR